MFAPALRLAVALAAALALTGRAAAEELTYDGATTIGKRVMAEAVPAFEQKTGVKFARVGTSGAGKGLKLSPPGQAIVAKSFVSVR